MSTFSKNITFGEILEVGEENVLMKINNQEIEIALPEYVREQVFNNAAKGIYLAPVDLENKRIVMETKDASPTTN